MSERATVTASPRVALVTGATGALGRAVATALAGDGWLLGLGGTDPGRLATAAREASLFGDGWAAAVGDVTTEDGAGEAVDAVLDRFGRVDALINLVGGYEGGTAVVDLDAATIQRMLDQHLWSTFHLVRRVAPGMIERGWGRVVAVIPTAAEGSPRKAAYAVAKAAQDVLLRSLAREVANTGVTANVVVVRAIDAKGERAADPKKAAWTTPDEAAGVIRFLCSDAAATVNGARVALNGRG